MTMQSAAAARGAWMSETLAPGENSAMSVPRKSKVSRSCTFSVLSSPKLISRPTELREASATTSSTGNFRSARIESISEPTAPVPPTTATL